MGVGVTMSDYFVPKLEILDSIPRHSSIIVDPPPPITELRRNFSNNNLHNLNNINNLNNLKNINNLNNILHNNSSTTNLNNITTNNLPISNNSTNFNFKTNTNSNSNTNTNTNTNNTNNTNTNNTSNIKPPRPHIIPPDSFSPLSIAISPLSSSSSFSSFSSPRSLLSPTTPTSLSPSEEDPNSPSFFIDSYTKIRSLSGEIFQSAGESLSKGFPADNAKIEFYAHELLKVARQLNNNNNNNSNNNSNNSNSGLFDSDDKKRPTPPLVRPRRIRRKHTDEEEIDECDKKRKIGTVATTEMYCHSCGTTDTPEWRRGPDNCKSLCNACGLHYAKMLRRETMIPNRAPARTTMTLNNLLN